MVGGCKAVLKLPRLTESTGMVFPYIVNLKVMRTDTCSCLADSAAHGNNAYLNHSQFHMLQFTGLARAGLKLRTQTGWGSSRQASRSGYSDDK